MYDNVLVQFRLTTNGTYVITTTDFTEDGEELFATETIHIESENGD